VTDIHKGIPEFLQYFSQMSDLASRSTLIIFGDGMLDLPGNVDCRFLGALSEAKDLVNVYRSCNVFVSPSRMETFGMTLLESQAAGTPVVAFEVGGTSEAVCHRQYGWLAKLNDYESLFSGLRWLLGDPQKARNVGLQASKWVFENFSAPVVAKKQIDVYNSVTT
jgi:glycosyltransferase involved in cell wall biosynthesis